MRQRINIIFTIFLVIGILGKAAWAAEITNIEGSVQVQPATDKSWKRAKAGMAINIGDRIQTARSSTADIALDNARKNIIRVEESTLVIINSNAAGEINRLDLSHGKIYANVEELKAQLGFEVKTPSAVAGVRGTGWSVDSDERRDEVATFKNEVFVRSFDERGKMLSDIIVPEGFKTLVERFEQAGELISVTENEKRQWNDLREKMGVSSAADTREYEKINEAVEMVSGQEQAAEELNQAKEQTEEHKVEEVIGTCDENNEQNEEELPGGGQYITSP